MTGSENDSWELVSSVGAAASMAAAARAAATRRPNSLIDDPYAEVLVRAAGVDLFARLASGSLEYEDVGPGCLPEFFAVRTRFFDDFVTRVMAGTARQLVIVASGLDSRAYRLEWPEGTVIYEIDQPAVIEFKTVTLARVGATPGAEVRTVGVDLRQDWPMALRDAGFDPSRPTAWIAEGLMIGYLPGDAQDRLLGQMTELSAPGSRLAADHLRADSPSIGSLIGEVAHTWKQNGFDVDFGTPTYPQVRSNAEVYLASHGWFVNAHTITDLLAAAEVSTHSLDTSTRFHGAIDYLVATRR
ncbi:SAM-dependent methyltransferase [Mycobacterium sp. URHB0021]|jgi:methyltransferase (TIGR00027 family)